MSLYLIGDLQGCDAALARLLAKIDFSASRDTLYLLGDLVNRGPDSLAVLRHGFGVELPNPLGDQLTKHNRDVGDRCHHDGRC